MHRALGWILLSAWILSSCTGRGEAVRAAEPHLEDFRKLQLRALSLLELRSDVERRRLLAKAMDGDEESLPPNLAPLLERMRAERIRVTEKELEEGEALFWRMLDYTFSENEDVLQAEIVLLEKEGPRAFRYPSERELPIAVKWYGLRQQRTFCALTDCVTESGSEPCLLVQLRPRTYPGSAGLTVAFRHAP